MILDGGPRGGRRIISLIPDLHICLVDAATIVANLPDAIARLSTERRHTNPLTFVSGPSGTVDIGFERVQGVHGPRRLHVGLNACRRAVSFAEGSAIKDARLGRPLLASVSSPRRRRGRPIGAETARERLG